MLSIDKMDTEHESFKKSNSSNNSNILHFMKKYQIANYQQLLKRSVENIEWYWDAVNEDLSLVYQGRRRCSGVVANYRVPNSIFFTP